MDIEERPSVCTFDCPDTCSLTVTVEAEHIVKVRGSEAMPFTDGVICNKVAQDMAAFVHGPLRLLHPLRRTGPKGAGAVRAHLLGRGAGRDPRAHQRGDRPLGAAGGGAAELCRPARDAVGRQHVAAVLPQAGRQPGVSPVAVRRRAQRGLGRAPMAPCPAARRSSPEHAQLNVVWGNNATVANLHLVRAVRRAKRKGGRLVVVDPLRTKIAEQADLHVALLPGTDTLLAWSLAAELERAGAFDAAFIAAHVLGFGRIHGAGARMAGRAGGRGVRRAGGADPHPGALDGGGRSAGAGAGQRAGARPQRRQRHPRGDRAAGIARQVGQGQRHHAWRRQRVSEDAGTLAAAGPGAAGHAHAEPDRFRPASGIATTSIRRCARCSSTTTIRSWCIRTRTACGAAWRGTTSSPSAST